MPDMAIEHMLGGDKLGHGRKTIGVFRKYRNFLHQNRHQVHHYLENNPYQEGLHCFILKCFSGI